MTQRSNERPSTIAAKTMTMNGKLRFNTRLYFWLVAAVCLCVLTFCTSLCYAQTDTATVSGRVTDQQALPVSGAEVVVTNQATGAVARQTTNDAGLYVFPGLKPGPYKVVVTKQGFRTSEIANLVLNVQDTVTSNVQLQVGAASETVTVLGDATKVETSPVVSTVVDHQFVENLPLNGRSFQSLVTLTPGSVVTVASYSNPGQFSTNGQRTDTNYFSVDGTSANVGVAAGYGLSGSAGGSLPASSSVGGTSALVSVDDMQEFRVQTSTFAPEYGRTPGAQVSIATRSGTNTFHGTAFEYLRNDKMDANNWFNNHRGLAKPPVRMNDFGGVFGGPLFKDRTFFFFSYEGQRLREPGFVSAGVPTVAARQDAPATIQPILNGFPIPNGAPLDSGCAPYSPAPVCFALFNASFTNPATSNAVSFRVDQRIGQKWNVFGRYNYAPSNEATRGGSISAGSSVAHANLRTQTLTGGATWTINPRALNDFRFNWSSSFAGSHEVITPFGGAVVPPNSALYPSFLTPAQMNNAEYEFLFASQPSSVLVAGNNVTNTLRQTNFVDTFSLNLGAHLLKVGADYRHVHTYANSFGYFVGGASIFSEALSGLVIEAFVEQNVKVPTISYNNFSLFAQDEWRANSRLVITYGLRWELNPPPHGTDGINYAPVVGTNDPATMTYGTPGAQLWKTTYFNFAPRIGFALNLDKKPGAEMVLRGGAGIFYDLGGGVTGNLVNVTQYPAGSSTLTFFQPWPLPDAAATPAPVALVPGAYGYPAFEPDLQLPRTFQWNASLEKFLGANQSVSATYLGAIGRKLYREEFVAGTGPAPEFLYVNLTTNNARSNYNALQLKYFLRVSRGLQALLSYSYSHSIDIASDISLTYYPAPVSNPNIDRGNSDFDIRNAFSGSLTYDIPHPKWNAVSTVILRNWSVDAIVTAHSAPPFDVEVSSFTLTAPNRLRPDLVSGQPIYVADPTEPHGVKVNPAAFQAPAPLMQGDFPRNSLRLYDLVQADFTLRRQFSLGERLKLQFRGEFFNLFNHPNFGPPVNYITQPQFGQTVNTFNTAAGTGGITGGQDPLFNVGGPRSIQLGLKLTF